MVMEPCCRCGQPIAPRRARHADRIGGPGHGRAVSSPVKAYERALLREKAVSSPVKAYHLKGRCYEDHRAAEKARRRTRRITNRINGRS